MVSPSEHLALPLVNDIVEGTRVTKVAAHIGDLVRKKEGYKMARERQMAEARRRLTGANSSGWHCFLMWPGPSIHGTVSGHLLDVRGPLCCEDDA